MKGRNADNVTRIKPVKGLYPPLVQAHLTGAYPAHDGGLGDILAQSALQELQQFLAGFLRSDSDVQYRGHALLPVAVP
jgi:hypothetical protein